MLSKSAEVSSQEQMPELDEGWWASVLADEEAVHSPSRGKESSFLPETELEETEINDWQYIQKLFEGDEIVTLKVYGCNRGGLLVQAKGIQGFVPVSHLIDVPAAISEEERQVFLSGYIGRSLELKVIECEPAAERVVLSERSAQAGRGKRKQLFCTLSPGKVVEGVVTNITNFGVFVDLGGVEGLIHVSELSWGRVQHPKEILQLGENVRTLVLQVSEENSRIALSLKRLSPNPWETLCNIYQPGDIVPATITAIMRFGAFARLKEGVEGLIHISSIKLLPEDKSLDQYLYSGQLVQVQILHIDCERRRLGLGLVKV